ncbi:MAG: SH3 domain-containing protein [Desulfamplus sp.]|nr:SH3 domain-containing protein [Desulfamplus sp.]
MLFPVDLFAEERLSVNSKIANVRSGPGIENDVLWQVEQYHPIMILEKKSGWLKFKDFEGDVAWIYATLVDKTESVITIKENCNVREGPGTDYQVAFTVERGVPFKVLEKKDNWLNIEHEDGDRGWIYYTLVW